MAVWPYGRMAVWPYGRMAVWPYGRDTHLKKHPNARGHTTTATPHRQVNDLDREGPLNSRSHVGAARSTRSSRQRAPMTCIPIGRPSSPVPIGTDAAGQPVRFAGRARAPVVERFGSPLAVDAGGAEPTDL